MFQGLKFGLFTGVILFIELFIIITMFSTLLACKSVGSQGA